MQANFDVEAAQLLLQGGSGTSLASKTEIPPSTLPGAFEPHTSPATPELPGIFASMSVIESSATVTSPAPVPAAGSPAPAFSAGLFGGLEIASGTPGSAAPSCDSRTSAGMQERCGAHGATGSNEKVCPRLGPRKRSLLSTGGAQQHLSDRPSSCPALPPTAVRRSPRAGLVGVAASWHDGQRQHVLCRGGLRRALQRSLDGCPSGGRRRACHVRRVKTGRGSQFERSRRPLRWALTGGRTASEAACCRGDPERVRHSHRVAALPPTCCVRAGCCSPGVCVV